MLGKTFDGCGYNECEGKQNIHNPHENLFGSKQDAEPPENVVGPFLSPISHNFPVGGMTD